MIKNKTSQYIFFILISGLAIFFDRLTKMLAAKYLISGRVYKFISDILEFTYTENRGASFGILQNQRILFYFVALIVICVVFYILYKLPADNKYLPFYLCIIFIFSGAVGNLIDRIINGYVVDFIYFKPINFPVFNVADIYITISVLLVFILLTFIYKEEDTAFLTGNKK